ncbi:hypothetical protein B0A48_00399 [Cryoendolithus antarcticus]|uniref:GH16 domain-containing protein n=1 Tax=Cryoendolithus antarcticus TaxID=1507870 RepID=A0A1V8TUJ6_9PEZI|nr:hypothetical protein B0A48_00399 [Cryoendolithus antarcticus]
MKHTFSVAAALAATFSVTALAAAPKCGGGTQCPSDSPCCSQYGQCGVGAYCLGGCDPQNSFDLASCVAAPVCKSADFKMDSLDGIIPNTQYLGDASKGNWVSSGTPAVYNDQAVLLTMAPSTVGTLLSSTHYVWYGKISATITTSQGAGVVTAFIMMSDVKDEIDFEFVGTDLTTAQSNYYFQGITDYTNTKNLTVSNTRQNSHTYTIDWKPDSITWLIDGNEMRTQLKSETWNATTGSYHFPQSPSRIQMSLWPAGLQSNGEGTIEWAGGLVNWDSQYMTNGYYYASVTDVTVECYDPPSGFNKDFGGAAYYYQTTFGTNDTIAIGNNNTILSSFYATGDNPSYCPTGCSSASASGTAKTTATAKTPTAVPTAETIPGVSGGGNAGNSGSTQAGDTSGNAESNPSAGNAGQSNGGSTAGGSTSFSQGIQNAGSNGGTSDATSVKAGSAIALVGFLVAAMMM